MKLYTQPPDSVAAFWAKTESFLMQAEAINNVMIGLLRRAATDAAIAEKWHMQLAAVEHKGEIVAVSTQTLPRNILLTPIKNQAAIDLLLDFWLQKRSEGHPVPGVLAKKNIVHAFADGWRNRSGDRLNVLMNECLYQLTEVTPPQGIPGDMRRVEPADRELLIEWMELFQAHALADKPPEDMEVWVDDLLQRPLGRDAFLWMVDGVPVSLAGYSGATPHGMRVGPVFTPDEHRRKGYASALVAALSQHILDMGNQFCFLYTDLKNPTSNSIYQKVGYRPICDVDMILFEDDER